MKKIFILLLLSFWMFLYVHAGSVVWSGSSEDFSKGSGTVSDPYLIEKPEQLAFMSDLISAAITSYGGVHFRLVNDLDLDMNKAFIPIGTNNPFCGVFDGNGHFIEGVATAGLFGKVTGGEIKNLIVKGAYSGTVNIAGGICIELSSAKLTNCKNERTVTGDLYDIGGIVGKSSGSSIIENCINVGSIGYTYGTKVTTHVGGIVGSGPAKILKCANIGSVSSSIGDVSKNYFFESYLGGICGYTFDPDITSCYNIGTLTGYVKGTSYQVFNYVGGILGWGYDYSGLATITNCYDAGSKSSLITNTGGTSVAGGILGYNYSVSVVDCYYVNGVASTGGTYKSSSSMISASFPVILNNLHPGVWFADKTPYVNNQYPIFSFQKTPVTDVLLSNDALNLNVGDTISLLFTVIPSSAYTKTVNWSSSDTTIATVDANGFVNTLKPGLAVISVKTTDGNFEKSCSLTVNTVVTGVEKRTDDEVRINVDNKTITVLCDTDDVTVYSLHGAVISSEAQVTVDNSGVYLVKVKDRVYKVLVQ